MVKTLFVVGGTWETTPWGLCNSVVSQLSNQWNPIWIPYPATYGNNISYKESYTIGRTNLRQQIDNCDTEYSILGYSQGAKIAGDIASMHQMDTNLEKVYLWADPERHTDDQLIGPRVKGHGVAGQRRVGWKARQFAIPNDIICCNQNPVFSYVASATATMSTHQPKSWIRTISSTDWQGGSIVAALKQADAYIRARVHSKYDTYEVEPGLTATAWILRDMGIDFA